MNKTSISATVAAMALLCPAARAQNSETPKIEIGFEQRVRNENWNNIFDWSDKTDDQRNQIRWRTRLWTQIPVNQNIDVALGLVQETNQIIVQRIPWKLDEIAFERAYVDFRNLFGKNLTLRVGRQDLIRGEGTDFLEGNPYDGSRSIYVNAAVLGYTRGKTKYELMAITDPSRDRYFPRINDQDRLLIEWNEQALGAYVTNKSRSDTDFEAYWFLKKEFHDTRPATNPQFQPDRHVHTFGARGVHRLARGWSVIGEGDVQRGADHAGRDIRGWSANGYLKRNFEGAMKPYVMGGYWGFSGDDPSTKNRVEGWDQLFGRWPKWSEMYIYSQFREQGVAYWNNTGMTQVEASFNPWKPIAWRFTWYHMQAMYPFAGNQAIFAQGTHRGEQVQSRMDFVLNPSWRGHVLLEYHVPGDFNRGTDAGYFLRFETIYSFRHLFPL